MSEFHFKLYSEVGVAPAAPWTDIVKELPKDIPSQYDSITCEYPYRPWWQKFLGRFSWYWSWYERDAWPRMPAWLGTKPVTGRLWRLLMDEEGTS